MEHSKYRSRLTVILVVVLLGLAGIFWPPTRLLDFNVPLRQKLNLKPGIDIKGGISLLYEIKASGQAGNDPELAQKVADALKKRVDPEGVRNLVWRPQGATRLEIQMPLSDTTGAAGEARKQFGEAQAALEATNIRLAEVRTAMKIEDPARRQKALDDLAMGSPTRKALFEKLARADEALAAAEKANDPVRKVDAKDDVEKIENEIEETNLSVARLQSELDLFTASIEKAERSRQSSQVEQKRKERDAKIAEFKAKFADFPLRLERIDQFVSRYDAYAKVKGSVDDAEDLKRLLRGSGVLEFHILVEDQAAIASMAERLRAEGPSPKAGDTMRWYEVDRPEEFKGQTVQYGDKHWVLAYTTADQSMVHREGAKPWGLAGAHQDYDPQSGQNVVAFEFDPQGAFLFGELSGNNIGKPLGIVLDDKLISAPVLRSRIESRGQISGNFSDQDLKYLIRTLNAGSLPARLADEPISERIVSPTLGADNLWDGFMACMVGLVVVAIFLLGYYYMSGAVAMVAVIMNMIIILGVLAMFGATFTLPGIAGMVLTLGSALDANVLIFERLREEQHRGLSPGMAIRNAYDRAWSAILDSNVITIITSVILYYFGSEEVKGFGLTLLIGIASSLFTSLFVTRVIFDYMVERGKVKKFGSLPLTFPKWDALLKPNFDWISKAWVAVLFSVLVTGLGMFVYLTQGRNMYDIEFVSGTSVQFELKEPATRDDVMSWITKPEFEKDLPGVQAVAVGSGVKESQYEVVTPNDNAPVVRAALMKALAGKLNVEVESKFQNVALPFDQALAANTIRPADDDAAKEYPWAKTAIQSHAGGVIIVLNDLEPPLTAKNIRERIERARLQPDRASMPYREMNVQVPGDPNQPSRTALVIVSDEALSRNVDQARWQEELAQPTWKLVSEAISKPATLQKVTNFNPQVARGMLMDAISALTISLVLVMIYVWLRFGDFKYGGATVVAMLHDVLFVIGAIGLSHMLSQTWFGRHVLLLEPFRMNLTLVAAVLTVMGYSMMDTIVVFDRIRENRGKFGYINRQIINESINQTLSRTLLTGGTTVVTVFVMYIFGGPGLHGFTFALLVGIIAGTYSSIAIASPLLLISGKDTKPVTAAERKQMPVVGQLQRAGQ